jgi:hypothetical protein
MLSPLFTNRWKRKRLGGVIPQFIEVYSKTEEERKRKRRKSGDKFFYLRKGRGK